MHKSENLGEKKKEQGAKGRFILRYTFYSVYQA
jgi:hypothetical protein